MTYFWVPVKGTLKKLRYRCSNWEERLFLLQWITGRRKCHEINQWKCSIMIEKKKKGKRSWIVRKEEWILIRFSEKSVNKQQSILMPVIGLTFLKTSSISLWIKVFFAAWPFWSLGLGYGVWWLDKRSLYVFFPHSYLGRLLYLTGMPIDKSSEILLYVSQKAAITSHVVRNDIY